VCRPSICALQGCHRSHIRHTRPTLGYCGKYMAVLRLVYPRVERLRPATAEMCHLQTHAPHKKALTRGALQTTRRSLAPQVSQDERRRGLFTVGMSHARNW
jgi:hypothetical protein